MSFINDFEVFPTKPPRFVAEIYPLLSFDSPLECWPGLSISIDKPRAHGLFSWESSHGIFSPTAFCYRWASYVRIMALSVTNTDRVWLPSLRSWLIDHSDLFSCPKCSWGSPQRALLPARKPTVFSNDLCSFAVYSTVHTPYPKGRG
jgi:hypothetical protein